MTRPLAELWRDHPPQYRATVLGNGRGLDRYEPAEEDGFVIAVNMAALVFPCHVATTNDQGIDWEDNAVRFEPFSKLKCIRVREEANFLGRADEDYYLFLPGRDIPYELTRSSSSVAIYTAWRLGVKELRLVGFNAYHDPEDTEYAKCLEGTAFKSRTQWRRKGALTYSVVNNVVANTLKHCGFHSIHWLDTNVVNTA